MATQPLGDTLSYDDGSTTRKTAPLSVVANTAAAPLTVTSGYLPAAIDRSGTITTGGSAQILAPANPTRQSLTGQNVSTGNIGINEVGGQAAIGAAGTYTVAPGQGFSVATNRSISIVGPNTGQAFTATET